MKSTQGEFSSARYMHADSAVALSIDDGAVDGNSSKYLSGCIVVAVFVSDDVWNELFIKM